MDADVIIVGAGPAGSAAALVTASAGLETVVLDKCSFPRPKPCGGGLSGSAIRDILRLFRPASATDFAALGVPRFTLRAHFAKRGPSRSRRERPAAWWDYRMLSFHSTTPLMHVTRRDVLDAFLLGRAVAAGATAVTGTEVLWLEEDGRGVAVGVRDAARSFRILSARFVIGADGAASVVARGCRASVVARGCRASVVARGRRASVVARGRRASVVARGRAGAGDRSGRRARDWRAGGAESQPGRGAVARCLGLFLPFEPDRLKEVSPAASLDFHFGLLAGGYGWLFPAADGVSLGVGAAAPAGRAESATRLAEAFSRLTEVYGLKGVGQPRAWTVPLRGRVVARAPDAIAGEPPAIAGAPPTTARAPDGAGAKASRVYLAGDAAGVADPLTGEGIGPAIRSGEAAARAVVARLRGRHAAAAPSFAASRAGVAPTAAASAAADLGGLEEGRGRGRVLGLRAGLAGLLCRLGPEAQGHLFRRSILGRLESELETSGPLCPGLGLGDDHV